MGRVTFRKGFGGDEGFSHTDLTIGRRGRCRLTDRQILLAERTAERVDVTQD